MVYLRINVLFCYYDASKIIYIGSTRRDKYYNQRVKKDNQQQLWYDIVVI